jgi:hypothetical protein
MTGWRARTNTGVVIAASNSSSKDKLAADYVCDADHDDAQILAAIASLPTSGGKIVLLDGTYKVESQINDPSYTKINVVIEGQGLSTIINYTAAGSAIYSTGAGWLVRDLFCDGMINLTHATSRVENCSLPGNAYVHIIDVGLGYKYATLHAANASISDATDTNRYLIRIFGNTNEPSAIYLNSAYIHIEGHNAKLMCSWTTNTPGLVVSAATKVSGLHIVRTGTAVAWNFPAISVNANATLVDCIGENQCGPNTLDRFHGIMVSHSAIGTPVTPTLIRCTGIGSINGCNDTRGIYLDWGTDATLIDCVGRGGGKLRGHGILCHAYTNATLHGCVGYDGSTSSDSTYHSSGIRFQGISVSQLNGCKGYASDVEYSDGISVMYRASPLLIQCEGYSGKAANSNSLFIGDNAYPRVIGGQYESCQYTYEWGYNSLNDGRLRPFATYPYYLMDIFVWVNVAHAGETFDIGTTVGGHEIAENVSMAVATHLEPVFNRVEIPADGYIYVTPTTPIATNDLTVELACIPNSAGCYGLNIQSTGATVIDGSHFVANPASDCCFISNTALASKSFDVCNVRFECLDPTMKAIDCESATENLPVYNARLVGIANNVTTYAANPNVNR